MPGFARDGRPVFRWLRAERRVTIPDPVRRIGVRHLRVGETPGDVVYTARVVASGTAVR